MARKKIIYVIVEGPSDDEALGVILNRLYDKNAVYVEITHGDITSRNGIVAGNIASKIGDMIRGYANANHYKAGDFQEVVHLIDMDGAFIPNSLVVQDENAVKPFYTENEIKSVQPDQILLRNARKSENINRICLMGKVWGSVPYRAYYMSANLDHVLYAKLNSTDKDKENDAFLFAKRYKDRLDEFLQFIADSEFSVVGDFKESWEFIKEGKHSLERYTNLGICFKEIRDERMANSCDSD